MCGIAGGFDTRLRLPLDALEQTVRRMTDAIAHRGPDDCGYHRESAAGLVLGHRRLSILDTSAAGHQPMASRDHRFVMAYNGEVYNFRELARELAACGVQLSSGSDTEVILELFSQLGVSATLPRLKGMFAFAAWDRQERVLHIARDRLGIKPMHWSMVGSTVYFASELKSFAQVPGIDLGIDPQALELFLRLSYVPAPHSIFEHIHKLEPGVHARFLPDQEPRFDRYWDAAQEARRGQDNPLVLSAGETADELDRILRAAVERQMVSDVPLGAFLSGGVDSSTVVAIMQSISAARVKTFSLGYQDKAYDETEAAAAIARHLGTDHTALVVEPQAALDVAMELAHQYDEPFADPSQIPTLLVCRLARRDVTVALSGDGGDEMFGGYLRYRFLPKLWQQTGWIPSPARSLMARAALSVRPARWDALSRALRLGLPQLGDKLHKASRALGAPDFDTAYLRSVSRWPRPDELLRKPDPATRLDAIERMAAITSPVGRMQLLDTLTYLPDNNLTKVDRASMSTSLEVRVPLLDEEVVEFAFRLPRGARIEGESKAALRAVLDRYVPRTLTSQPKKGFDVPIDTWLRGPMRDWAEDLLSAARFDSHGLLRREAVMPTWQAHQAGSIDARQALWNVLMFQGWHAHLLGARR
jgi:asparagine synthase (glutamine-hydrolysing)